MPWEAAVDKCLVGRRVITALFHNLWVWGGENWFSRFSPSLAPTPGRILSGCLIVERTEGKWRTGLGSLIVLGLGSKISAGREIHPPPHSIVKITSERPWISQKYRIPRIFFFCTYDSLFPSVLNPFMSSSRMSVRPSLSSFLAIDERFVFLLVID